jgi:hypothetical protein
VAGHLNLALGFLATILNLARVTADILGSGAFWGSERLPNAVTLFQSKNDPEER